MFERLLRSSDHQASTPWQVTFLAIGRIALAPAPALLVWLWHRAAWRASSLLCTLQRQ